MGQDPVDVPQAIRADLGVDVVPRRRPASATRWTGPSPSRGPAGVVHDERLPVHRAGPVVQVAGNLPRPAPMDEQPVHDRVSAPGHRGAIYMTRIYVTAI